MWPCKVCLTVHVAASHTLAVLSLEQDASILQSGLHTTDSTTSVLGSITPTAAPITDSHNLTVLSSDAVATSHQGSMHRSDPARVALKYMHHSTCGHLPHSCSLVQRTCAELLSIRAPRNGASSVAFQNLPSSACGHIPQRYNVTV